MENLDKKLVKDLTPEQKEKKKQIQEFDKNFLTSEQRDALGELNRGNPKKFNAEFARLKQQIEKGQRIFSEIDAYFKGVERKELEKNIKKQKEGKEFDEK